MGLSQASQIPPFTRILNTLIAARGWKGRQVARQIAIAESTLNDWRAGSVPRDFQAVARLARLFEVSFSYLLTGEEEKAPDRPLSEVFAPGRKLFDGIVEVSMTEAIPRKLWS
jgi:transcriptional regulator with XRE-family HTH domain